MARILVTEQIADNGLQMLRDAGHTVDEMLDLSPEQLLEEVRTADALVIRSATKVTQDVLEATSTLQVVGRAGIGLDNVDVAVATKRGVMVVNAPQSNILSAAEHTIALLLAQARNVPQSHSALVQGKWERSKWEGVELYGKTLGVVGLGRVGALVAQRALAFGMKLISYDPYVSQERARKMGVEMRGLEDLFAEADFITIHLPKNKETVGLVNAELLAKAKPSLRIVNTARGGIIDEVALAEAIKSGTIQGAALDVFASEPTTNSPLFSLPSVIVTPHLGASTTEAQDKAGITIAEQLLLAFNGDFVPFAVNVDAAEASETVKPFLSIAESLGRFLASMSGGLPAKLEVEYQGVIAEEDTRLLTLSVLKGIFSQATVEPVSFVNAPQLAMERGLEIKESSNPTSHDYVNLVTLRTDDHEVSGTIAGIKGDARIVRVDGHTVEVPPAQHMLVVHNDDKPGKIGVVGMILGEAGLSISSMAVSPSGTDGTALMVISVGSAISPQVTEMISKSDGILYAKAVTCS